METKNVYGLPFRKRDLVVAFSDPRAHFDHFSEAIDFTMPLGSEILAALDGEVVDVSDGSDDGGADPKFVSSANYVTITHGSEHSQYVHLAKGLRVKVGDHVKKGEVIGLNGATGYTTAPHLHFMVFHNIDSEAGWESLKIKFDEPVNVKTKPEYLSEKELDFLSKNCL